MTPEFTARIRAIIPTITHGWCSADKAVDLAEAVLRLKSSVSVEIGVWGGRSLLPMALAHKEQQHGIVWAIDSWSAKVSAENEVAANIAWWGAQDHEPVYQYFLTLLKLHAVEEYVKVIRAKSDDVIPPPVIDFLHLDGSHTDQAVKDVDRFASKIRPGGFLFLDDLHWQGGGVERAAALAVSMGFIHVAARDTGGMFMRPSVSGPVVVEVPPPPVVEPPVPPPVAAVPTPAPEPAKPKTKKKRAKKTKAGT